MAVLWANAAILWRSALALRDLQPEHINRASSGGVLLDVFHCADHAAAGVRIVGGDLREGDRCGPAADAGIGGDVLIPIRTKVGDRGAGRVVGDVNVPDL